MNRLLCHVRQVSLLAGLLLSTALAAVAAPAHAEKTADQAATPRRVVSLAPSITQTIIALGAGDHLAAVTSFCLLPEEIPAMPRLGGQLDVNIEALARLEPDLVLVQGQREIISRWCRSRSIPLLRVDIDSLDSIETAILDISHALGMAPRGRELVRNMRNDLQTVRKATAGLPRPRVFLSLGPSPGTGGDAVTLFTAGRGAFISEVLDIAGGENVFADLNRPWAQVSLESLAARRPEVILELRPDAPKDAQPWSRWDDMPLPGLGAQSILLLSQEHLLMPGPRVTETARLLATTLHPEAAHDLDHP